MDNETREFSFWKDVLKTRTTLHSLLLLGICLYLLTTPYGDFFVVFLVILNLWATNSRIDGQDKVMGAIRDWITISSKRLVSVSHTLDKLILSQTNASSSSKHNVN